MTRILTDLISAFGLCAFFVICMPWLGWVVEAYWRWCEDVKDRRRSS